MLALDLLAAHLVGDFILQTDRMATRKLSDWRVRAVHVTGYCGPFAIACWANGTPLIGSLLFLAALWITHFVTDSRRWASGESWPPKPILVDQAIHVTTLALLSRLL